jgi:hypothetical protein
MVPLAQLFELVVPAPENQTRSRCWCGRSRQRPGAPVSGSPPGCPSSKSAHARIQHWRFRPAQCQTDADTMLRIFPRPIEASVGERELGRADGKLRITIETLQSMGRKEFLRRPVRNFRRAMRVEDRAVEAFTWRMPLRSARRPFQKPSRPMPAEVIGPSPVITARLFDRLIL